MGKTQRSASRLREVVLLREEIPDGNVFPFTIPALTTFRSLKISPSVTFLVGENGSGKSTLVEAIAVAAGLNPEGGSKNLRFQTRSTESKLHECLRLVWQTRPTKAFFLRAETFYNTASAYDELGIPGFASYHELSHGESFIDAVQRQFTPGGFYVLDEPESALSLTGQLKLLRRMHDLLKGGSQFIVATHSPILLAFPKALIYRLDEQGITKSAYEETEQYQLTRSFLESPERFFRHLFAED